MEFLEKLDAMTLGELLDQMEDYGANLMRISSKDENDKILVSLILCKGDTAIEINEAVDALDKKWENEFS